MKCPLNVAFLSTYPPRECGIATFTQDLVGELKKKALLLPRVIAVSDRSYRYDADVLSELVQQERRSYGQTAERINHSLVQVLVIEHEYGIYGGENGEYLLDLVARVEKPLVTTVHTVLPDPSPKQKIILQRLGRKSQKVVTMAANSMQILRDIYKIDPDKIAVIPHGVPNFNLPSRDSLKAQTPWEQATVVSTFGLIGPGKGIEYGIEAIAKVVRKHPQVVYLILGQTHPVIKKHSGEAYRESLERLVKEKKLERHVRFVNKYLTKEELVRYLQLSDIYMTPYLGRDQAVSGTLAYALGYGRVIVSTPYRYAREMLAGGRGLLAEFKDADALAACLNFIIEHPEEKRMMEQKTRQFGKKMLWGSVAEDYEQMLQKAFHDFDWGRDVANG